MIRICVFLNLALSELQFRHLGDIILEFIKFVMLDHPIVQIRKFTKIIGSLPSVMFVKSKRFLIPRMTGDVIEFGESWEDNYFTPKQVKAYDDMLKGLSDLGLITMAKYIDENRNFSREMFLDLEEIFGFQNCNGYCNSNSYLSVKKQVLTGVQEVQQEFGVHKERAKQRAILDWENPLLRKVKDYEQMKEDYFKEERYLLDYIDEDVYLESKNKQYSDIRKEFKRKIEQRIQDIAASTEINNVIDYVKLMRVYYNIQTSKSAGGLSLMLENKELRKRVKLSDKNKIAPFFVNAISNYKDVIDEVVPITTGKRTVPGAKTQRTIYNSSLVDYVLSRPAYHAINEYMKGSDVFADTTGDNFLDHGNMIRNTCQPGVVNASLDAGHWDSSDTSEKRIFVRNAIKKEFNWKFDGDLTIGELTDRVDRKTYRAPLIIYNYDLERSEVWFASFMKSGENKTSVENGITNSAILETAHELIKHNEMKFIVKKDHDQIKGDDGYASFRVKKFDIVRTNDKTLVVYPNDVIEEIDKTIKLISLAYEANHVEVNTLKGGAYNNFGEYLKKRWFFGYEFKNKRIQAWSTELPLRVSREEWMTTMIAKFRLAAERGGNDRILYKLLIKLIIPSSLIKIYTERKENVQRFAAQRFYTLAFKVEDGGVGLPISVSQMASPNSSILALLILQKKGGAERINDELKFMRMWYQAVQSSERTQNDVDFIISKNYKITSKNNYNMEPAFNIAFFDALLIPKRKKRSINASKRLDASGIYVPTNLKYTSKLQRYYALAMKGSNPNAINREIRADIIEKLYKYAGQKNAKAKSSLVENVLKHLVIERSVEEMVYEESLPNIAIGSSRLFYLMLEKLKYSQRDKIQPMTLKSLQAILDKDPDGPADIKAELFLKQLMDPTFLLDIDNMRTLLEAVGFSGSLATELMEELKNKIVHYLFVETATYSYTTETAVMMNMSKARIEQFIKVEVHNQILEPIVYGVAVLLLFEMVDKDEKYKYVIKYNIEDMNVVLARYGYVL